MSVHGQVGAWAGVNCRRSVRISLSIAVLFGAMPLASPVRTLATDCTSANPADWPAAAKPYVMIIADTSGSMTQPIAFSNSCGLPNTRNGHLRCALRNTFNSYASQVNLGLSTYAVIQGGCAGACFNACQYNCFPAEINTTGICLGCGPRPGNATTRAGAFVRVPVPVDSTPPPSSNLSALLAWTDNVCSNQVELFALGNTPLNGSLRDMYRYYSHQWVASDGSVTFPTPLRSTGNGERTCRSVNVVLITDGDETCDTQADAVSAAAALYNGFTVAGINWRVRVFVINLVAATQSGMDQIAAAGGTAAAYFAQNADQIELAMDSIIDTLLVDEACGDGVDNNCNGCTDESTVTAQAGNDATICPNTLTGFTATPGGGTGPYSYAWTTSGGTLTQATQQTANFTAGTGTYQLCVTVTDSRGCGRQDCMTITVGDSTQPTITCPVATTISCESQIPAAATDLASFMALGGTASDDCGTVTVMHVGDGGLTGGGCGGTVTRTYRATDNTGNTRDCTQVFTVNDAIQPTITCPAGLTVSCEADIPTAASDLASFMALGGTASDNCGIVTVIHVGDGGLTGGGCGGTVTRTYRATDSCNNNRECTQVFTVHNNTPPTFDVDCPMADFTATSTDPSCTIILSIPAPPATDHCGMAVASVLGTRDDGMAMTDPFPIGTTVVTWTATDACSQSATCAQNVVVDGSEPMYVSIALAGSGWPASLSRCIRFELYECPGSTPVIIDHTVDFTNGQALGVLVPMPCGTTATCITVRDRLHSLRRRVDNPAIDPQGRYVVDCTGAGGLVMGNLNDDRYIDILDYGVWAGRYLVQYDSNGDSQMDGHTPCTPPPPARHADVSGNGEVFNDDFTFLQINFFTLSEGNCCDLPGFGDTPGDQEGPVASIKVAELLSRGLVAEAAGDVNGDGILDMEDMVGVFGGLIPVQPMDRADAGTSP